MTDINENSETRELKLYNEDIKMHFLNEYIDEPTTYENCLTVFRRTAKKENELNKDLHSFSRDEIISVLRTISSTSVSSLSVIRTNIKNYITFCMQKNYRKMGDNYAKGLSREKLRDFLDKEGLRKKYILDENELKYIVDNYCYNARDGAIITMLWEGLGGLKLSELRLLKVEDYDIHNNTVKIIRDNETIDFPLSDYTVKLIEETDDEEEYVNPFAKSPLYEKKPLIKNDYVLRATGKDRPNQPISEQTIITTIKKIGKSIEKYNLNPTAIRYSGAVWQLRQIEQDENRDLKTDDFKEMCYKFGMSEGRWFNLKETYFDICALIKEGETE